MTKPYINVMDDLGPSHTHSNNDLNFSKRKKKNSFLRWPDSKPGVFTLRCIFAKTEGVFQVILAQLVHAETSPASSDSCRPP